MAAAALHSAGCEGRPSPEPTSLCRISLAVLRIARLKVQAYSCSRYTRCVASLSMSCPVASFPLTACSHAMQHSQHIFIVETGRQAGKRSLPSTWKLAAKAPMLESAPSSIAKSRTCACEMQHRQMIPCKYVVHDIPGHRSD